MLSTCPNGDLRNATALDELLAARASPNRELTILILGSTHGKAAVTMKDAAITFIEAQVRALSSWHHDNYVVVTTTANAGQHRCQRVLRPLGICCAWSDIGIEDLLGKTPAANSGWQLFPTHPFLLFVQRWWVAAQALTRGYSVLSLDADLHLSIDPYRLVHMPALRPFDVLFQGDAGWPVRLEGAGSPLASGEVGVRCSDPVWPMDGARSHECVCGVTAAPSLNTGFVYARARRTDAAQLFNATVATVLARLRQAPVYDRRGTVHQARLWPQAVMNEVVFQRARQPLGWPASRLGGLCHPMDADCQPFRIPDRPD